MKNTIGMILAIVLGILLGFFGVFNSVFSDGPTNERLVVVGVILVIYGLLGFAWGFFMLKYSWKWGLFLSIPGSIFLLLFTISELNPYYLVYMLLLIGMSCLGAYGGNALRNRRPSEQKSQQEVK